MAFDDAVRVIVWFLRRVLELLLSPLLASDGLPYSPAKRDEEGASCAARPGRLPVAKGDRVLVVGAGVPSAPLAAEALAAGAAAIVVADGSEELLSCLGAAVRRTKGGQHPPSALRLLQEDAAAHAAAEAAAGRHYDAVLVGAAGASASAAAAVCGCLRPGGALVIGGAAAPSLVLGLARGALGVLAPHFAALATALLWPGGGDDGAVWLAAEEDLVVESRRSEGWGRETLYARKRPGSAAARRCAVERLRRLYGSCSMAYCMSPGAGRVGSPEKDLKFYLYGPVGEETGCIAYMEHTVAGARLRCVIMDPIAAAGAMEGLLRGFMSECEAVRARPIFSCVSAALAEPLAALGCHTTKLGAEIAAPLRTYTTPKERRRYLRIAPSKGLEVFSKCYDFDELEELNQLWLAHKATGNEAAMWTWPPSLPRRDADETQEDEVRRLFTYLDGVLVGFVCAEPFYKGDGSGEILGYGLNTIRFRPNVSPAWASDYTIAALIEDLQAEGKAEYLAFGLSPFTELSRRPGDSWFLSGFFELMWDANFSSFYNFIGLAKKKAHHCSGQAERLQERLICGPRDTAIGDYFRFMSLLVDDIGPRIPAEAVGILTRTFCRTSRQVFGAFCSCFCKACGAGRGARRGAGRRRACCGGAGVEEAIPGVGTLPQTAKAEAFMTCVLLATGALPLLVAAGAMRHLCW